MSDRRDDDMLVNPFDPPQPAPTPDPVVEKFTGRFETPPAAPPAPVPAYVPAYTPVQASAEDPDRSPKNRGIALLLAFFLGFFGAHNFYLGYKKQAVTQLVLWIAYILLDPSGLTSLILFIMVVWVIADLARLLFRGGKFSADADGRALS